MARHYTIQQARQTRRTTNAWAVLKADLAILGMYSLYAGAAFTLLVLGIGSVIGGAYLAVFLGVANW